MIMIRFRRPIAVVSLGLFLGLLSGNTRYPQAAEHSPAAEVAQQPNPAKFEIRAGDHISILGNTLADRMQHDGWLETLLPQSLSQAQSRLSQPRLLRR